MLAKVKNGIYFMQFPNLVNFAELIHGVFTRHTGVSLEPFDSLNISFGLGDDDTSVHQNRDFLKQVIPNGHWAFAHQVHGAHILIADTETTARSRPDGNPGKRLRAPTGDALVAGTHGLWLAIQVADCQAVLLYDPVHQVAANVHAGWRGSIANVVGATVARMKKRFGCRPSDIIAGIGPSLGPCCAEFVNYKQEIPQSLWHHRVSTNHFDFWAITREQLDRSGVSRDNVCTSEICTRCNPGLFFSYRGEKVTGRFAAVIGLRPGSAEVKPTLESRR